MSDHSAHLDEILQKIGIVPQKREYYETACVHRSFLNESAWSIQEHNERLEFLGDAVLELVMTHLIYTTYPDKEEGWMTDLRSSYVRGTHLAEICLQYGLDTILLLSQGERNAGGARNPNILADLFEAILWALYLDQWFSAAYDVIKNIIFTSEKVRIDQKDPKSRLQELIQQHLGITPLYTVVSESGPDHGKMFTISASILWMTIGTGIGMNKKSAQELAALDAFENQEKWQHLLIRQNNI